MFPLGTVLFPGIHQSLRIFEPRYREMIRECIAGDGRFGVVLIERGSEVGGGDIRFATGTMASVVQHVEMPDGNWLLDIVGTHRIRVIRWLADDPYPRAMIEDSWESEPTEKAGPLRDEVATRLRRALALRAELGEAVLPATLELAEDPAQAAWEAPVFAELGSLDCQQLLDQPGTDERLSLLVNLLDEEIAALDARMGGN
jgi:Lon protease-like protein